MECEKNKHTHDTGLLCERYDVYYVCERYDIYYVIIIKEAQYGQGGLEPIAPV